jgi:myosin heavy subunit
MGSSRVFLTSAVHAQLESMRFAKLEMAAIRAQRQWRMIAARISYLRLKAAAVVVGRCWQAVKARKMFLKKLRAVPKIQAFTRGWLARRQFV